MSTGNFIDDPIKMEKVLGRKNGTNDLKPYVLHASTIPQLGIYPEFCLLFL